MHSVDTIPWYKKKMHQFGRTEEPFQPPKSHQMVDGIHHQIKSSLFFSLFRTGQSEPPEKGKKAKNMISKLNPFEDTDSRGKRTNNL